MTTRRDFLKTLGLASLALPATGHLLGACSPPQKEKPTSMFFTISLAEWSLHRALYAGELDHLDFPVQARQTYGIEAVEYVNSFFKDKAKDTAYLSELKKRCDDNGVTSVLIMCDGEGEMANLDSALRQQAVENHYKWVEAAAFLGCHSIRVNCFGIGTAEELAKAGTDGLHRLASFAQPLGINVIVENHGGYSSNGQWLSQVITNTGMSNCGTLPDFGNFCIRREEGDMWGSPCVEMYDRYQGVDELMPFAKGVSAKSYDFDEAGNCVETDYARMLPIVKKHGYTGYIGIEYEGNKLSEPDGIRATKELLLRLGTA